MKLSRKWALTVGIATLTAGLMVAPVTARAATVRQGLGISPVGFGQASFGQVATPAGSAEGTAASNVPQADGSQAYRLSPDKLAKAIALSRIRNVLDIAGSIWSLVVLWLLLMTRAAAGLEGWVKRIAQRRWVQGVAFFATLLVVTAAAALPLDMVGHHFERAYSISVQGW